MQVLEKVLHLLWSRIVSRSQLNFASDESVPYNELGSSSLRSTLERSMEEEVETIQFDRPETIHYRTISNTILTFTIDY